MDINRICFIVGGYPTASEPIFTFVKELISSIADNGIECSVIAPQSITKGLIRKQEIRPFYWVDYTKNNSKIEIYQPKFLSVSNKNELNAKLSSELRKIAVTKTFKKINKHKKIDVIYGHFWHNGILASSIGEKYRLPVFVASGESKISIKQRIKRLKTITGVICVSTKNMRESIDLNLAKKEQIIILPNAIDNTSFYNEDKVEVRKRLGYNQDDFIVAFTGSFNDRKGVLRLSKAIEGQTGIKAIYIGSGELKPSGDNVLFCGRLPHKEIVHYLNSADVFVLPTKAEGCSNAIVEAMACGLPIISSNKSFNDDILNNKNSLRIDEDDINSIRNAILFLKNNPMITKKMSRESLISASSLSINDRSKKIIEFMNEKIIEGNKT